MKNSILFTTVSISLTLILSSISTFAAESSFELKAFVTPESQSSDIEAGLRALYKDKISENELKNQLDKSSAFQSLIYNTLNSQIAKNKMLPVKTTEKRLSGNFVKETTVEIPSLIQRQGNHASNKIVARIYEVSNQRAFCDYKYPTTIMLHHILNEVELIEDVAKVQSSGLLGQPAIVVVIHMPHYGQRRQGNEEFLTSDLAAFRKNMAQLILDVHVLKNYLESRKNIDPTNLSLSGISLGAVMGLTVGAFDQSFSRYGFLVGGVDMANILMNRVRTRPSSEVAEALKGTRAEEPYLRDELAAVDSMTWLHRIKNKRMFLISASRDDIVDYKNSVEPMVESLKKQNNEIDHKVNDDEHSPTGSAFKKLRQVFMPLLNSVVKGTQTSAEVCPPQDNNY